MTEATPQTNVFQSNAGKAIVIRVGRDDYARIPVRTHVITAKDAITDVVQTYASPRLVSGDIIFISERIVAITQGRAFPIRDIAPSPLAKFLVRFVHRSPYGIGLASPWTMELAIREAGVVRILIAAFAAAVTKPLGIRGVFYRVCGKGIAAIDGPCSYTLPPYNEYAKLGPAHPNRTAAEIARVIGAKVVIIDANDLGVAVLGRSDRRISDQFCKDVFRDNPLGQSREQTPIALVRKV